MDTIVSVILMLFNIFHVIFALLLTAASIWFFLEVQTLTNLRDTNHYLLKTTITWTEAIPWIFMLVSILVLLISCCGCLGATKKTRALLQIYVTSEILVVLSLIAAVVVTVMFADSKTTNGFIQDTMVDGFNYMRINPEVEKSFGEIEYRFQCCGADEARDYLPWKTSFPASCCGSSSRICSFNDQIANHRHGCIRVMEHYTRKFVLGLCAGGAITAIIGLINIIITVFMLSSQTRRPKDDYNYSEADTKKMTIN